MNKHSGRIQQTDLDISNVELRPAVLAIDMRGM
jgi:hypothetical protein